MQKQKNVKSRLITVKDAAEVLGLKENSLRQQIFRGVHYGPLFEKVDGQFFADKQKLVIFQKHREGMRQVPKNLSFSPEFVAKVEKHRGELCFSKFIEEKLNPLIE